MLINALRTAEHLSRALEARAFGVSGRRRTIRKRLHFRRVDGLLLLAILVLFGGVMAARIQWGFGRGPLL
jgi:energy-coupling factor transporter transmembrane protein EcfT